MIIDQKHKERIETALQQYKNACDEGEDKISRDEAIETQKTMKYFEIMCS